MDTLARARELALTQQSLTGSYSGDSALDMSSSRISSPGGSSFGGGDNGYFGSDTALDGVNIPSTSRLRKEEDAESLRKGRKRFSRRQSKGGLAAVF
jgi:3-phosphoinositide dependent protein kinase-1